MGGGFPKGPTLAYLGFRVFVGQIFRLSCHLTSNEQDCETIYIYIYMHGLQFLIVPDFARPLRQALPRGPSTQSVGTSDFSNSKYSTAAGKYLIFRYSDPHGF